MEELGLGRQAYGSARKIDFGGIKVLRGGKPALLVELVIVGQIGLGHNTQQRAILDNGSTVEQQATSLYGQTNHTDNIKLTGEVEQHEQSLFSLVQQQLFLKQILTGIARERELWKA